MKKFLKILLIIVVLIVAAVIIGMNSAKKMDILDGSYSAILPDSEEEAMSLMEYIEAYEEEIALADLTSLEYAKLAVFTDDGYYSFGYDVEGTKACVRQFLDRYFNALYLGRTTLNSAYGTTFDDMTWDEFSQFFAELYSAENYDALLDSLASGAYDYDGMEEPWETGTYSIRQGRIYCIIEGETEEEFIDYKLEGDALTLEYSDATQHFTRID